MSPLPFPIFRPEWGSPARFPAQWHDPRLTVHHKLDGQGQESQARQSRLPFLCSQASVFFMLHHSSETPLLSNSQPISFRKAPLANRPPTRSTPIAPEGTVGQHIPGGLRALRLLSKHSRQCTVISCVPGPLTPLNLENQADFSRQQSAPRHIEP